MALTEINPFGVASQCQTHDVEITMINDFFSEDKQKY